ncbi:MAG: PAS domain-containing protein, partial [Thermoplasmata archaeon]
RSPMAQTAPSEVAGAKGDAPFAVLVIDGNEEHQILSVAALTRRGWTVRTATTGKQALQLAIANRFDAVVVGSKLRDATGVEVLRLLSERFPATPKIFVVPPDGEEAALQAMKSGASSYIVKTPRYTELLPAIVEEHIVEARNRRRLAETEQIQAQAVTERKTAEERLSQSETRLRMILRQAPVLLWSTDKELRVTSAMGGGFRSLDTSRSEERGLTLHEYFSVPDEDLESIASHRRALAGESVTTQIEWQGRSYDVHIEPLRSAEGSVLGTIGVAFDVSERTRTEETLRRSEERFRLLGRATNDVVWDWDLQTDGMWVNENASTMFGYPAEEIEPTGTWWTDRIHPQDRERVVASRDELVRHGGTSWTPEYRFRRRDGTYATVVDRAHILHDATGHPVRIIGSRMDVTHARKKEAIQSAVYRISEAANSAKDLPELFAQIHSAVGELMPAANFYIALHDERHDTLEFPYFVDEEEGPPPPQRLGRGLTEHVLRTGRPLLASSEVFDGLVKSGEVVSIGPPSVDWLGAPLVDHGKTIGVIVVQSYTDGVRFADEDKAVLTFVSEQVAMAIDRKRTQERLLQTTSELQANFQGMLESLANPIRRAVVGYVFASGPVAYSAILKKNFVDSSSKLSFHLQKLQADGLLTKVDAGRYSVTDAGQRAWNIVLALSDRKHPSLLTSKS